MDSTPSGKMKDKYMMTFLLRTRTNEDSSTPVLPSQTENPVETSAEQSSTLVIQSAQNEPVDDLNVQRQVPDWMNSPFSTRPRWNRSFESNTPSHYLQGPHPFADTTSTTHTVDEPSQSTGPTLAEITLGEHFSENVCDFEPLRSRLASVYSHLSSIMRHCKSCEQSLQEKVNDLPVCKITDAHIENADLCSVCMENYTLDEEVKKLHCSHLFHGACISPWLKMHQTCPICRKNALPTSGRSKKYRYSPYHHPTYLSEMNFLSPFINQRSRWHAQEEQADH